MHLNKMIELESMTSEMTDINCSVVEVSILRILDKKTTLRRNG